MIKHYRYDLIGADLDYGVKEHPQTQMKNLGFHVIKSEPFSIADCWVFRVDNDICDVPGYLHEMGGVFTFSDEMSKEDVASVPKSPPIYKPDGTLTDYGKYMTYGKEWRMH